MEDVKGLVSARGHKKQVITRVYNFVQSQGSQESESILLVKKERLVTAFKEYENLNIELEKLGCKSDDEVEEYENKYTNALASINSALSKCSLDRSEVKSSDPRAHTKLPNIEIKVFTGKYSEYVQFKNVFMSVIDKNSNLDNIQKLYYLRNFLKHEPLDLIINLPLTSQSYSESLKILDDRYGNNSLIMSDHITQLLDLSQVKSNAPAFREFISHIKQNIAALKNLDPSVSTWDPILMVILIRKIDSVTAKAFQMDRDITQQPTLQEFLDFLQRRALAMESVSNNGHHQQQSFGCQGKSMSSKAAVVNVSTASPSCIYCNLSAVT